MCEKVARNGSDKGVEFLMVPSTLYIIQRWLQENYENGDMNKDLNSVYLIFRD
jgi:hypothetical protein